MTSFFKKSKYSTLGSAAPAVEPAVPHHVALAADPLKKKDIPFKPLETETFWQRLVHVFKH